MTEDGEDGVADDSASATPELIEISGVTKRFAAVIACDEVSLSVPTGEVRGLLGQNGAGKTTLMNVVGGVLVPDAGRVLVGGEPLPPGDPIAAATAGVGVVHQHFSLIGPMTVWENVTLGERGRVNQRDSVEQVDKIGHEYGIHVDPHALVSDLSPRDRQRVEIIKCLRKNPRVVILDEPTSVLSQTESRWLFDVLRSVLPSQDRAVILISHRLEEILTATDRVTVMRDGRVICTVATSEATAKSLATQMLGRDVALGREGAAVGVGVAVEGAWQPGVDVESSPRTMPPVETTAETADTPLLEIRDVVVVSGDGQRLLDELSFSVGRGEVLGVAGVEGNGQGVLVDLLSGLAELASGTIRIEGEELEVARHGRLAHIGVIPPDRHDSGGVLGMSVMENLALGRLDDLTQHGVLSRTRMARRARELVRQFAISVPSVHAPLWSLSGGNQQRLVLARELSRSPTLLVASQPTRGLDVGAMEDMWSRLRAVAAGGTGVLLVSTELDEIIALANRIVVMQKGRIVGEMSSEDLDPERLGLLMGGQAA